MRVRARRAESSFLSEFELMECLSGRECSIPDQREAMMAACRAFDFPFLGCFRFLAALGRSRLSRAVGRSRLPRLDSISRRIARLAGASRLSRALVLWHAVSLSPRQALRLAILAISCRLARCISIAASVSVWACATCSSSAMLTPSRR